MRPTHAVYVGMQAIPNCLLQSDQLQSRCIDACARTLLQSAGPGALAAASFSVSAAQHHHASHQQGWHAKARPLPACCPSSVQQAG